MNKTIICSGFERSRRKQPYTADAVAGIYVVHLSSFNDTDSTVGYTKHLVK
jgi:hypothetical protein